MHRYDEPIEVHPGMVPGWGGAQSTEVGTTEVGPGAGSRPGQGARTEGPAMLIWHDRLWVVREIHACWTETAPWWDGAAARAVRGESVPADAAAETLPAETLLAEIEVWRVLAHDARYHRSAVLEIGHGCDTGAWRLRAVLD